MQSGSITYYLSVVHYRHGGRGSIPLVCLHGYGETAANFDFLERTTGEHFLILAIDLPFHGNTEWNEQYVYPAALADIVQKILQQLQVNYERIYLLGFSLGGRMALCVLQELPEKVSKLVLLAPDGLKVNFWYWLAAQSAVGNALFRFTMRKPGWFLGMLRVANKLKLINQSIYKFVQYYIHDEAVRKSLYERWTGLSKCTPDAKKIKHIISEKNISLRLLYGKYDRIITQRTGRRFLKGMPGCKIEVLDCGHQVLHEKNAAAIRKALLE